MDGRLNGNHARPGQNAYGGRYGIFNDAIGGMEPAGR